MNTNNDTAHRDHAQALRAAMTAATIDSAATTEVSLRTAAAARAAGGPPTVEPYDQLARLIGDASYRVTDADIDAVRHTTGSDKATFEIVMSACIGAGLARWDAAIRAIEAATEGATDAPT